MQKAAGGVGGSLCLEMRLQEENHEKWTIIKFGHVSQEIPM